MATITMPPIPAPKSIEPIHQNIVAVSTNPFTGQQQVLDWNANWLEISVTMPPMPLALGQAWIDFLIACRGQANTIQISNGGFLARIPASANVNGLWRLKSNAPKWSVNEGLVVGMQFELREAI
jgi:hypothetical protein